MSSLLVYNRVYRLVSHVSIFDPSCAPLTFSLVHLPPPPLPCVNKYRFIQCVTGWGGGGVSGATEIKKTAPNYLYW
jgi:hypothetical protein